MTTLSIPTVSAEVFVISRGSSALYRTLLSISKQEMMPQRVVILHPKGQFESCRNAFLTVREDDGNQGFNVEYIETDSASIYEDKGFLSEVDLKFFLVERDMFLPHHISSAVSFYRITSFAALKVAFFQRLRFGNSKVVKSSRNTHIPASTAVISKNYFSNFDSGLKNLNTTLDIDSDLISLGNADSPSVIVQSNIKSPYA